MVTYTDTPEGLLDRLDGLYMVDVVCDASLEPFYDVSAS